MCTRSATRWGPTPAPFPLQSAMHECIANPPLHHPPKPEAWSAPMLTQYIIISPRSRPAGSDPFPGRRLGQREDGNGGAEASAAGRAQSCMPTACRRQTFPGCPFQTRQTSRDGSAAQRALRARIAIPPRIERAPGINRGLVVNIILFAHSGTIPADPCPPGSPFRC